MVTKLLAGAVSAAFVLGGSAAAPTVGGCTVFPADNPWNMRVDSLPVAANSDAIVATIGTGIGLHPDFGSGKWQGGPIGIPYDVVTSATKKVPVSFDYASESDAGPYPIPTRPTIEYSSDHHELIVNSSECRLYELYALTKTKKGWHAGSGAIWDMSSNALRPEGWTSADAAGLQILPGLARADEVLAGSIDHALRFTVQHTRRAYVYPARHYASSLTDPNLPPMGLRLRLKASFDTSTFPPQARVVLEALKRYGMVVADNGSNWYISGAPDSRWSNDDLHTLGRVTGSNFEVVDPASIHP
ncbi:MAG TPA: hypothetical protein VN449_10430 [Gaiellaceae bacterium]|nr:hypothetical protein [Gaiellaceae bacterium]